MEKVQPKSFSSPETRKNRRSNFFQPRTGVFFLQGFSTWPTQATTKKKEKGKSFHHTISKTRCAPNGQCISSFLASSSIPLWYVASRAPLSRFYATSLSVRTQHLRLLPCHHTQFAGYHLKLGSTSPFSKCRRGPRYRPPQRRRSASALQTAPSTNENGAPGMPPQQPQQLPAHPRLQARAALKSRPHRLSEASRAKAAAKRAAAALPAPGTRRSPACCSCFPLLAQI